jgi:hypothetical protein
VKAINLLNYLRFTALADGCGLDTADVIGVAILRPDKVEVGEDGTAVYRGNPTQTLIALGLDVELPADGDQAIALTHEAEDGANGRYRMGVLGAMLYAARVIE